MEFYAAYWNYLDLMTFTESLIRDAAQKATGSLQLSYAGKPVDLSQPFERLTIRDAIIKHTEAVGAMDDGLGLRVDSKVWLTNALRKLGMTEAKHKLSTRSLASLQVLYFEETVEEKLWQPTFIMEHRPKSRHWPAPMTNAPKSPNGLSSTSLAVNSAMASAN
jgi:lysyl-tRNA synthetase class 2